MVLKQGYFVDVDHRMPVPVPGRLQQPQAVYPGVAAEIEDAAARGDAIEQRGVTLGGKKAEAAAVGAAGKIGPPRHFGVIAVNKTAAGGNGQWHPGTGVQCERLVVGQRPVGFPALRRVPAVGLDHRETEFQRLVHTVGVAGLVGHQAAAETAAAGHYKLAVPVGSGQAHDKAYPPGYPALQLAKGGQVFPISHQCGRCQLGLRCLHLHQ